jgi:hypothetical protein
MTKTFRILVGAPALAGVLAWASGSAASANLAAHSAHPRYASFRSHSAFRPFANDKLNQFIATHQPVVHNIGSTFVAVAKPKKPSTNWLIGSSEYGGTVDLIDGNDNALLATCSGCGGWGVAVNKTDGDLAVITQNNTISVYHKLKAPPYFIQYATLTPQSNAGWYSAAIAYDANGGVWTGNLASNQLEYFSAATIAGGGGLPNETIEVPDLAQTYYMATDGNNLIADGFESAPSPGNFNTVLVRQVHGHIGDVMLQSQSSTTGFPGGLTIDKQHNLTINNQLGSISTYAKPWTGSPTSTLNWYNGASDWTGIALGKGQTDLYAAEAVVGPSWTYTDMVVNGYDPLGAIYGNTGPMYNELYIALAVDPAAK